MSPAREPAQSRRASSVSAVRPRFARVLATGLAGIVLLGAAFQSASAGGLVPGYGAGLGGDGDGLSAGAIAGIAAGVGLGGAAVSGVFGAAGVDDCEEPRPRVPERLTQFTEIRLIPRETTLDAGECRCFFLEVRAAEDKKWYSVTHHSASTLELQQASECVVKRDGSKNVFCVPIDAPKSCDGKTVTIVGTFTPMGQAPMTATARILVRIPQTGR